MIDIGIVILSSGRVPYLKATIKSLINSKVDLKIHDVHVVINGAQTNLDFFHLRFPEFNMHYVSDNSLAGLMTFAYNLGSQYEFCFFVEEDWLFNKQLTNRDLYFLASIPQARQVVFSKFRKGHEIEEESIRGVSRVIKIAGLEKTFLKLDTYFSFNPTVIRKEVLQEINRNFDWRQPNNSGVNLEKNLNKFLGERFGYTILVTNESKFNVTHLGLLTATKYINLVSNNHGRFAENLMRLHILLLRIKHSNEILKRIYIPRIMRRLMEMR